ncbi:MAG: tetratricopeptide repeat protein, partial [Candidatus Binatia bacterium]
LPVLLLCAGCPLFQVRGEIHSGREALVIGRCEQALGHLLPVAHLNPHYVSDFTDFQEGVWTYVGRAHYQCGEWEKALKAFEKAHEEHREDHLAQLYLGLLLMRNGQESEGFREVTHGLRSLKAWLRDLDRYDSDGSYWDPGSLLEDEIESLLSRVARGDVRWQGLAPRVERLGIELEQEIDRVLQDVHHDDGDGSDN